MPDALVETDMAPVERLAIPTPFNTGHVNCYLVTAARLTLIDPGPATDTAYETLCEELSERGFSLEDIDRILVTHPHMDHFGIVSRLRSISSADVYAHPDAVSILADPDGHFEREQAFFEPFLVRMGVPEATAGTVMSLPMSFTEYQAPVSVDVPVQDGDHVDVGFDFEVVHTPGHCPGSVCFVERTTDTAYSGDHLMTELSPNPLLTVVPGTTDTRTRSLPTYLESLDRLRETGVGIAFGGHRDPVTDVPARIEEIVDHHETRKRRIASFLAANGRSTAYDLLEELFPDLPASEVFPGMSEIIGHLDLLEDEGAVVRTGEDRWYYELDR